MPFLNDLKVYKSILFTRIKGATPAERLESFYAGQAPYYDDFRRHMLHGRQELYSALPVPDKGIWLELGGGTASNLQYLGDQLGRLRKIYLVDLCDALLAVARQRIQARQWPNVELVRADATAFTPPEGYADVITFSYSLSMMPTWSRALEHAWRVLRPGGSVGVVDYYVSRKQPAPGHMKHSWLARFYWPRFFRACHVYPSPDHLPCLCQQFRKTRLWEGRARIPYFPWLKPPCYLFIGQKMGDE